jgi:hypothetical protein
MKHWNKALLAATGTCALLLAACGGGGGSSPAPTTPTTLSISSTPTLPAPVITTQPQDQSVQEGASASFTILASGGELAYQWQRNGSAIGGATAASYSETAQSANNGAKYKVVVSNVGGSVTSTEASLTVTPSPARTAVGSATGPTASAAIGAAGGSVVSLDGRATVTVAADTFASTVTVTVQPVQSKAPGGLSTAYSVSWPAGVIAAKPVSVKLALLPDCRMGTAASLVGAAEQRLVNASEGDWYRLRPSVPPPSATRGDCTTSPVPVVGEIEVAISEPRVLGLYAALALKALTADVAAGAAATITVAGLCADPLPATSAQASAPLPVCSAAALPTSSARTASVGTLANGTTAETLGYTAPPTVAGLTPAELTVTYAGVGAARNVTVKTAVTVAP